MYIEMNPTGLTLTDLICVAHRKRSEDTGFPYAVQSCRCSNCRYVGEGQCSLRQSDLGSETEGDWGWSNV